MVASLGVGVIQYFWMKHLMILTNQGRSLSLRQTNPNDAAFLAKAYQDETFVKLYRSNNPNFSEEEWKETLEKRAQQSPIQLGYVEFMLVHKQHGNVGVAALGEYSPLHQRAEYLIGLFEKGHRHLGLGIEATLLVLDLAFNSYHLNKVYSYVYDYNEFSHKNMINLGFNAEGVLIEHHYSTREKRFLSLFINGLTVTQFRQSEKIRRLSQRLVGRDITQVNESIILSGDDKLPLETGSNFITGLRKLMGQG